MVFQALRQANLKLKPKKCRLFQKQVVFLSHVISADGVSLDPEKVSAVSDWPVPKTVKQVRSFVVFCNYYRRFIKDLAKIAQPLHELTKKQARFNWTLECQLAFDRLRFEPTIAPMRQFPKYNSLFIVVTDASNVSLGAVLFNVVDGVEQPIVYASQTWRWSKRWNGSDPTAGGWNSLSGQTTLVSTGCSGRTEMDRHSKCCSICRSMISKWCTERETATESRGCRRTNSQSGNQASYRRHSEHSRKQVSWRKH